MRLLTELRRRNVFRVAAAYVVSAWLIIQVVETVFPPFGFGDGAIRAVVITLGIGLVPVLILSWVFELTPEGLKLDKDVDPAQSVGGHTGKRLDRGIVIVLVLALSYFAFDKFVIDPARDAEELESARQEGRSEAMIASVGDQSIAVLPFVNMSSDEDQEYFSDGLSEELLNLLAKIPALRVIARTSSFSYKGKDIKIADVSRELNVDYVLEGSVRKAGARVRITAQLVRAEDSSNLWADTYERTLDDIFQIQDEIAAAVVTQLKVKLLGAAPASMQTNTQAYALYLQARELARQSTEEGHERSIALYQQALEIAPDYAAAWAGLAEDYVFLADRALRPIDDSYALAREAANKALILDPQNAMAYAMLGRIAMVHDKDLADAAQNLERALELDPTNPQILRAAAVLSMNLNRLDEAISLLEYAAARDPVSSAVHSNLALNYFGAGRLEEALASYRTALNLSPGAIGLHSFIGTVLLQKSEPAAALAAMEHEPSEAWRLIGLVMAHHALGQSNESDTKLVELIEKYGAEWPYNISYVLAYRGEADRAFEWLGKAKQYNDPGLSEVATAPEFTALKSDTRWLPFLESIGKAPQQLAAVEFEVTP